SSPETEAFDPRELPFDTVVSKPAQAERQPRIATRLGAFVAERHPLLVTDATEAFETAANGAEPRDEAAIEALRPAFRRELTRRLRARPVPPLPETTPRIRAAERLDHAYAEAVDACDGFLRREAI